MPPTPRSRQSSGKRAKVMSKRFVLRAVGYLLCLLPPTLAILERFPLWAEEGRGPMLSGLSFLLLLVASIPLRRGLLSLLRRFASSPSAYGIWGVVWILAAWLGSIAEAVADIALVGTLSSLLGALFFRLGGKEAGRGK